MEIPIQLPLACPSTSLVPRPFEGRRKGLVHTVCACVNFRKTLREIATWIIYGKYVIKSVFIARVLLLSQLCIPVNPRAYAPVSLNKEANCNTRITKTKVGYTDSIIRYDIRIPSGYWENRTCANSAYQALSPPLKGPGYEASPSTYSGAPPQGSFS